MEYFCISDIHGYYDVMKSSLIKAGFDSSNPNHTLVVIGDMVDRGPQNKETLDYIYSLHKEGKAIVILGNHDEFLLKFFYKNFDRTRFDCQRNGHKRTLEDLYGDALEDDFDLNTVYQRLITLYPHYFEFLKSLPYFYEIGSYIFVHGGVDGSKQDWKQDTVRNFVWNRQHQLKVPKGKTVICGHTQNIYIREPSNYKYYLNNYELYPEKFDILHQNNTFHIDGSVHTTKNINVLKLEI
jgi:serine/threonine protein phosphatase 1